ncbi:MAG: molybdenum ABC transporter ATP-binding protein [Xanthobacteraceae bacterium]|nr:molybdenum ABC transporter ATP-binding protein [Xanthobacteraceae bacterium]MBX3549718.1 molybdenum ABC transporter ATP-binding protein [Xanthobacteraceae bacterium]MCW5676796.1 molybdenum ABC transporter ATP-binding protein [Xanthobacteraceae bacterium]
MFDISITTSLGDFKLDVSFKSESMVTALSGPSGSGKSSVVAAITGLLKPARGKIVVNGRTLFDSAARIDIPTQKRGVRVVFQESRLFPHFTVAQNLMFGRWLAGKKRDRQFDEVVSLLGIEPLLARRPRKLSGGERQRVAIGRALLAEPQALLLDEPLASLDADRKEEIIPYLTRLVANAKIPVLYVSHARDEIERLAQTIVKIDGGRVIEVERR